MVFSHGFSKLLCSVITAFRRTISSITNRFPMTSHLVYVDIFTYTCSSPRPCEHNHIFHKNPYYYHHSPRYIYNTPNPFLYHLNSQQFSCPNHIHDNFRPLLYPLYDRPFHNFESTFVRQKGFPTRLSYSFYNFLSHVFDDSVQDCKKTRSFVLNSWFPDLFSLIVLTINNTICPYHYGQWDVSRTSRFLSCNIFLSLRCTIHY